MTTSWHSYPKVWSMGHSAIKELFEDEVIIEEKIDGSQFSFGVFEGEFKCRSKGQEIVVDQPEKMFVEAVSTAIRLKPFLTDGWTYRAEYLARPGHNILKYNRTPRDHLIIFDVNSGHETYLSRQEKEHEAKRIGLEIVPILKVGKINSPQELMDLLNLESYLGGPKIEGVVAKNYSKFGPDKKVQMGKFVSESFKEEHKQQWKVGNPGQGDVIQVLREKYKSETRWKKAVQHLRESGKITDTPKDIGALIREARDDAMKELKDPISFELFQWAWPQVERAITTGLPEWYKEQLLQRQFTPNDPNS